jgi:hypothetical protein
MQNANWGRTRRACYYTNIVMASAFSLPPMLFGAFHSTYGISYTLLGTLVLVNFFTQMLIDLVLTFFGRYFPNKTVVRCMPLLTAAGLLVYAEGPTLFPEHAYAGLVCGTVIFSVAAGCCEVLLSPVIAAMPSDDPGRDMSRLHSLYGYGVLLVVAISALYFQMFGTENWAYLASFFALLPVLGSVLLFLSPMPEIELGSEKGQKRSRKHVRELVFCAVFIFFGGVAECTMTNWVCVYLEKALSLPKVASDMLGLAAFAALLALTRTLYAKYGRSISKVLGWSMVGGVCCYLVAGLALNPVVAVVACMLTGVCTGMLWPGTLILMEEKIPRPGVTAYALMATCGDLGGAAGPQLLGAAVDATAVTGWANSLAQKLALTGEQVALKAAMLMAAAFLAVGFCVLAVWRKVLNRT